MPDNSIGNIRIARNSIFMAVRMVIVLIINLYTSRVVLEVIGVVDFGIYNVVAGVISMFTFLSTSMHNGIQRFFNFELGRNGEKGALQVFNTAFAIQFCLAAILLLPIELIGIWFIDNKMSVPPDRLHAAQVVFQFALISFLIRILSAPWGAAIMAYERMDFYALVSVLNSLLMLVILYIIPLFNSDNLIIYGALISIVTLIDFSLNFSYCRLHFKHLKLKGMFRKNPVQNVL